MLNSLWKQDASGRLITLWTCEETAETPCMEMEEEDVRPVPVLKPVLTPFARPSTPGWYNLTIAGLALISFAAILVAIGNAL